MKTRLILLCGIVASLPSEAATIYSGLQDIVIPTSFGGLYLDLDTGATGGAAFAGWDANPFFGGAGFGNSAAFQPARVAAGNLEAVLNLGAGSVVSSSLLFASGVGGSGNPGHEHLGLGSSQFQPGTEGYLGFRFTTNGGAGPNYGWMRVVFTANAAGALVKDWAYENTAGSISTGNILQSAPSAGVQVTTLSGGSGESYTLGSTLADGANTTALVKAGSGTWSLSGTQTFSGTTTVNAGTLDVGATGVLSATASIAVNSGGTLMLGGSSALDQIADSASLLLAGGRVVNGSPQGFDETVGTLTLSASSVLDFGAASTVQQLAFANSTGQTWSGQLHVWNWTAGIDRLTFGADSAGLTGAQLSQIRFFSDAGFTEVGAGFSPVMTSLGEVVPVPEPAAVGSAMLLLGLAAVREGVGRRRSRLEHAR